MSELAPPLDEQGRARAAELLAGLADLTGEAEALAGRRREAAAFAPDAALVELYLDLLAAEDEPAGWAEALEELEAFIFALGREGLAAEAPRLAEGLGRLASGAGLDAERARRLREAAAAVAAARGEAP